MFFIFYLRDSLFLSRHKNKKETKFEIYSKCKFVITFENAIICWNVPII